MDGTAIESVGDGEMAEGVKARGRPAETIRKCAGNRSKEEEHKIREAIASRKGKLQE
jgi:hypothetical protein